MPNPPLHNQQDPCDEEDWVVVGTNRRRMHNTLIEKGDWEMTRSRRRNSRASAAAPGIFPSLRISSFSSSLMLILLLLVVQSAAFLKPSGRISTTQFSRSSYQQQHHQQQPRRYNRRPTTSLEQRWKPSQATIAPTYSGNDEDGTDNPTNDTANKEEEEVTTSVVVAAKKEAGKEEGVDGEEALTTPEVEGENDNNLDALHARAGKLRRSILKQQIELQQLERKIMCCYNAEQPNTLQNLILGEDYAYNNSNNDVDDVRGLMALAWTRATQTFWNSGGVLWRKLQRVRGNVGVNNERWNGSVGQFMAAQSQSGVRIVEGVLKNQTQLLQLMDPNTPTLIAHVPAIVARLDKLESHMATILERVLNNQRHLASIEPYLDEILERFDDIEPHLPWILDHIDTLAPYTGLLLKHIDELLPYAQLDDDETLYGAATDSEHTKYQYALAEQLLPYLEFYVSRLDTVGPHLPLLRPHVPKLLKHNRIAKMSPHIDKLFALGYKDDLGASANMDVLLFWFGWALRVPGLPQLFFAIPGSPRLVTFLANRLPKRFVRGYCSGISCTVDEYQYGNQWNKLSKK